MMGRKQDRMQKSEPTLREQAEARVAAAPDGHGELRVALSDITRRKRAEQAREQVVAELQAALVTVKTLRGLIPICAGCRNVRNDEGYWQRLDAYISAHTTMQFTHGLCPNCVRELYPDMADDILGPQS